MSDPDLLLHLTLDELHGNALFDTTEARRNGASHGAKIVVDDGFGQCLELQGNPDSYVELPSLKAVRGDSQALTFMLWVKPAMGKNMSLVELNHLYGESDKALGFSLRQFSNTELLFSVYGADFVSGQSNAYHLVDDDLVKEISGWFHLAFVKNQNGHNCYLNGRPFSAFHMKMMGTQLNWTSPAGAGKAAPERGFLGKSEFDREEIGGSFEGRVAQLRVYNRALTPEEINWDMEGDRPVQYRYRITHPIDFSLENGDADPTLFMDGHPDGQKMTLRVDNVSSGQIHLAPLPGQELSETNCHFELAFRPGTLAPGSLGKVAVASPNTDWKIASKVWAKPNDRDSLYLLCTNPGPLPGTGLTLELEHLLPDARYGTRATLVDFRYKNLKSGGGEAISGNAQQNLDLINHLGRRNIPLHVGFAGSNLILNKSDRSTKLRLRVTNVLPRTDLLGASLESSSSGVLRFDEKSQFIISFDERPGTDWALDTPDRIGRIVVRYAKGQMTDASPTANRFGGTEGKPWQWAIPLKELTLGPEEHLEIRLENVTATGSYGHSNLYFDYRNVPGYWDGRFTCMIEKTPLTYFNGKVGVGVAEPHAELEVKGALKVDSLIVNHSPAIHILERKEGWEPFTDRTPKYFKDSQGIVHLTGECYLKLPPDWNAAQKRQWVESHRQALVLPSDCVPALQLYGLNFPAHVQFWPTGQHYTLFVHQGEISHLLERSIPDDLIKDTHQVRVYLDGISYLARS
ncbi:MAG TPA: LamG domain-containing protein [Blastocatellia bacterium]|nr:LamG domain-containing protein [Blastocatellia bacterium]